MKIFRGLIIMLIFSAFQAANTIAWQENSLLNWTDFKGKPDSFSPYQANTETEVVIAVKTKGDKAFITIQCYFNKSLSWVKDVRSDLLLSHEQMHFNITEISVRRFRQRLSGKTFIEKDFQRTLSSIHSEIHKESKAMQAEYDKETEHAVNEALQKKWNTKITKELASLSAFAGVEVTCKLKK